MTDQAGISAGGLVLETQHELVETAEAIRSHRFLERLRTGNVPDERLRALAGEQHAIVSSDSRSFAQLAARFPSGLAGEFFLGMAEGEGVALDKLRGLADWLGLTEDELRAYEPHPGAQAYPAFVAWLALNGSRADVALAFLANLAAWGENCGKVAAALRDSYRAGDDAVAFFDFFASSPEDFESRALAVLQEGLTAGDSPVLAAVPPGSCRPTSCPFGTRSRRDCDAWAQRGVTRQRGRDLRGPAPPPVRPVPDQLVEFDRPIHDRPYFRERRSAQAGLVCRW